MFKRGQRVRCTPRPEWGIGIVSSDISDDGKFYVEFKNAGLKQLTPVAKLELVADSDCRAKHRPNINGELTVLLRRAKATLEMNRAGGQKMTLDDASWADAILHDVQRMKCPDCGAWIGNLTKTTESRLRRWCHSTGALYQAGKPIAEEFSKLLYGHVIPEVK